ncbi:hypothetical protein NC652_030211 [Populus alba x Populus x berolinensis]|nr:hypothetical protein NC652_030211 [Populus alba x Populus x berolinensis]
MEVLKEGERKVLAIRIYILFLSCSRDELRIGGLVS